MIVVAQRDEAKRLQSTIVRRPHGTQHLGHAVYRAGLRLEGNLDKITLAQEPCQRQQAAGYGDGLKFALGALTVFQQNEGGNCAPELDSRSTSLRMWLGEMGHSQDELCHTRSPQDRLRKHSSGVGALN